MTPPQSPVSVKVRTVRRGGALRTQAGARAGTTAAALGAERVNIYAVDAAASHLLQLFPVPAHGSAAAAPRSWGGSAAGVAASTLEVVHIPHAAGDSRTAGGGIEEALAGGGGGAAAATLIAAPVVRRATAESPRHATHVLEVVNKEGGEFTSGDADTVALITDAIARSLDAADASATLHRMSSKADALSHLLSVVAKSSFDAGNVKDLANNARDVLPHCDVELVLYDELLHECWGFDSGGESFRVPQAERPAIMAVLASRTSSRAPPAAAAAAGGGGGHSTVASVLTMCLLDSGGQGCGAVVQVTPVDGEREVSGEEEAAVRDFFAPFADTIRKIGLAASIENLLEATGADSEVFRSLLDSISPTRRTSMSRSARSRAMSTVFARSRLSPLAAVTPIGPPAALSSTPPPPAAAAGGSLDGMRAAAAAAASVAAGATVAPSQAAGNSDSDEDDEEATPAPVVPTAAASPATAARGSVMLATKLRRRTFEANVIDGVEVAQAKWTDGRRRSSAAEIRLPEPSVRPQVDLLALARSSERPNFEDWGFCALDYTEVRGSLLRPAVAALLRALVCAPDVQRCRVFGCCVYARKKHLI